MKTALLCLGGLLFTAAVLYLVLAALVYPAGTEGEIEDQSESREGDK